MVDNYEKVVDRIAKVSGVNKDEINRCVEAKRARLSGLISREGAAQVVAAELGVSFDNEKLKINELLPGMRKVNVSGKIIQLFPVRAFTTKKGEDGKVCNMRLADDTANVKVVLWDTNHIALIEKGSVKEGSVIEICNGSIRDEEIHLGSFSEFKLSNEKFDDVKTEKVVKNKEIKDFKIGDRISVRAFVVQSFEPRFFYVCPECSKKVVSGAEGFICAEHGKVNAEKRALINIVIDDGSENIRAVFFREQLEQLVKKTPEEMNMIRKSPEAFVAVKNSLLGDMIKIQAKVTKNQMFERLELIAQRVEIPNPKAEIERLNS